MNPVPLLRRALRAIEADQTGNVEHIKALARRALAATAPPPAVEFWIPGLASTWSVPRINRWGGQKSKALAAYQDKVATFAKQAGCKPVLGPMAVRYAFIMRQPKRACFNYPKRKDLTNLVKATEDALNGIAWSDDSQVTEMAAEKLYVAKGHEPGIRIAVAALEDQSRV